MNSPLLRKQWSSPFPRAAFLHLQQEVFSILSQKLPEEFLLNCPLFFGFSPQSSMQSSTVNDSMLELRNSISLRFEEYSAEKLGNKHGVVYTPPQAAVRLIEYLHFEESSSPPKRLLDPACGSGNLLCAALLSLLDLKKLASVEKVIQFLQTSLIGFDRDPIAIEICRLSLLLTCMERFPDSHPMLQRTFSTWSKNLICGNSLVDNSFDPRRQFGAVRSSLFDSPSFSHIVANPPYGLSREEQIESAELRLYAKQYKEYLFGKPNKYLLFLVRAIQLLKRNGRLSFLIPNSWMGIDSGKKIRSYLLSNGYLRTIEIAEEKIFRKRGVETIFLSLQKAKRPAFSLIQSTKKPLILETEKLLKASREARVPLFPSTQSIQLWDTINAHSQPLSASGIGVTPKIALQVYATGKGSPPQSSETVKNHLFHSTEKLTSDHYPYLVGKDVGRYRLAWSGSYLRYGPWVAEFQPIERYSGPRVLVREVLGKHPYHFIATYTEETYFYNRSILHFVPDSDNKEEDLLALTALLNSQIGSFYLRINGRKASRSLFPKVVNEDLKEFPLPNSFQEIKCELAKHARHLLSSYSPKVNKRVEVLSAQAYGVATSAATNSELALALSA